jgi:oxygen-independent coproporphyrinogen III oxidase
MTGLKWMMDRYTRAVIGEMRAFSESRLPDDVDSIYFGGGTPSLIPAEYIEAIIDECRNSFSIREDCEISLEANPGTVTPDKAMVYRRAGVNRISLGAQTFNDDELTSIGRVHDAAMISESRERLRAHGFDRINMDLMLGLPRQTAESWRANLEYVERAAVPHISLYMLDLDDECPLKTAVAQGTVTLPDEELVADLYVETVEFLASCGYGHYEISNFARNEHVCRHNMKYWKRNKIQGFGLGSHSFDLCSRTANSSNLNDYLFLVENGRSPVQWSETLSPRQALQETLFLGLRLTEGIDWSLLRIDDQGDYLNDCRDQLKEMARNGLVEWKKDKVRLTLPGMLLSNEVLQLFV